MAKAPDAFRTISEVSTALDTPAHVLRFWESKFSQIKPVKRAGGRRYYRPEDVTLLAGIKTLLHSQGMTIKGAQKLLREKGVKHVQAIGADGPVEDTVEKVSAAPVEEKPAEQAALISEPPVETAPKDETPTIAEEIAATDKEDTKQPALEISNITAFRRRAPEPTPAPAATPELPPNPKMDTTRPARYFGAFTRKDDAAIKAKAAQIAPLLARLETVRDQMRKS